MMTVTLMMTLNKTNLASGTIQASLGSIRGRRRAPRTDPRRGSGFGNVLP